MTRLPKNIGPFAKDPYEKDYILQKRPIFSEIARCLNAIHTCKHDSINLFILMINFIQKMKIYTHVYLYALAYKYAYMCVFIFVIV